MKTRTVHCLSLYLLIALGCICSFAQVQAKEQIVEVPFDFYHNEIFLQVRVNGKGPFNMMLDTGTDPSAVDLATAREIGLKLDSKGRQGSGGGTDVNLAYLTKLPLVDIGSLSVKNITAAAIDLSKVSTRLGRSVHGVLGHSLLSGCIVQIDYPGRVVRFYSKSPFPKTATQPNTSKRTVMPFRYNDNVLIRDVEVDGTKMVANFDTGSSGTFDLTPEAITLLGLEEEFKSARVSTNVGYNGMSEHRVGNLKNVTIGSISVDSPPVTFFVKGTGHDKRPWGINIGNVFLKDFVVTIDYRAKLITLERP